MQSAIFCNTASYNIMVDDVNFGYLNETGRQYYGLRNINTSASSPSNLTNVGSDTNKATVEKVISSADGSKGGQCGRFVNQITGLGLGDSYQSKMAKMDPNIKKPAPGMVFVMPYRDTGHTGFIVSVNDDGTATVKDSNYDLNEKVKTHKIALSKLTGFKQV
jgi:surface antigen